MLNGEHYLCKVELRLALLEVHLIVKHLAQISSRQVLQHEDMALLFTERKRGLHKMISCNFLEDLVLVFYGFELFLIVLIAHSHYLQGVIVSCLLSPN